MAVKRGNMKMDRIDTYSMKGLLAGTILLAVLALGILIFLHTRETIKFWNYAGIIPLIIGVPGLLFAGANLIYLGLTACGGVLLCLFNINDKGIAWLIALGLTALIGFLGIFFNRKK